MLESEIRNDPLRKHKFAANLTEERGGKKKILSFCLCWFWFLHNLSMSFLDQFYFIF